MALEGFLDFRAGKMLGGWAWDSDDPGRRVEVEILLNDGSLTRVVANQYRHDLEKNGIGDGAHAFWHQLPEEIHAEVTNLAIKISGSDIYLAATNGQGTKALSRTEKMLEGLSRNMRYLEIGPSFNPVVPKRDGWKTWTIDHLTRDGLIAKYRGNSGVDIARIEDVDFVWEGSPVDFIVPSVMHGTFDVCIASHVIEHIPNFVGFFHSLGKLLCPNGIVSLAVPDKRYCFDYFRPHSTTGQIIEAHKRPEKYHRPHAIFDHFAYACTNDGEMAWGQTPLGSLNFTNMLSHAWELYSNQPSSDYMDCHAWQFTPSSFELIALELGAIGLLDFKIIRSFETEGCEFIVHLQMGISNPKSYTDLESRRLKLLHQIVEELGQQAAICRA